MGGGRRVGVAAGLSSEAEAANGRSKEASSSDCSHSICELPLKQNSRGEGLGFVSSCGNCFILYLYGDFSSHPRTL